MRNFTKFSLVALIILVSLTFNACKYECKNGSGKQTTVNRTIETFSSVQFGGSYKVIISQDSSSSIKITADDNVIEDIITKVSGGVLEIKTDGNYCNVGEIVIELSTKQWKGIEASGASQITSVGQIKSDEFDIKLSGTSTLDLDLVTGNLKTNSSGDSKIMLKGQARSHEINFSGTGILKAFDFVVGDYKISTSGASELEINVLNDLKISTSGTSKVSYKGTPKNISNDESGSSELIKVQ
jgi:hypothetical protein